MEFALSSTTATTSPTSVLISRLHRHFNNTRLTTSNRCLHNQLIYRRLKSILIDNNTRTTNSFNRSYGGVSSVISSSCCSSPRSLCGGGGGLRGGLVKSTSVRCISRSAESFAFGGGGGGRGESGGFGGDGGRSGGDGNKGNNAVAVGAEELSGVMPDVIILDVEGMTCGGCAASVKRILESQPQVSSASVNLTTETAVIWPISEAKVIPNWQKELGEALAKHLTTCGFKSNLRGEGAIEGDIQS